MEKILEVKNLAVRLDGELLIHKINFELSRGESMAVLGPNGAGKTILLKALLGIVPHEGIMTWAPGTRVGYVPQKIDADRHTPINALDLFRAKCRIQKILSSEIKSVMARVGIVEKLAQSPLGHLSGGQAQKVLIALALLGKPQVLFFDEPTANLDETAEGHVYELIHKLEDENMAIILVSHDVELVASYVDKVLCINREGVAYGIPEETLTAEVLHKLYGAMHGQRHHHRLRESEITH